MTRKNGEKSRFHGLRAFDNYTVWQQYLKASKWRLFHQSSCYSFKQSQLSLAKTNAFISHFIYKHHNSTLDPSSSFQRRNFVNFIHFSTAPANFACIFSSLLLSELQLSSTRALIFSTLIHGRSSLMSPHALHATSPSFNPLMIRKFLETLILSPTTNLPTNKLPPQTGTLINLPSTNHRPPPQALTTKEQNAKHQQQTSTKRTHNKRPARPRVVRAAIETSICHGNKLDAGHAKALKIASNFTSQANSRSNAEHDETNRTVWFASLAELCLIYYSASKSTPAVRHIALRSSKLVFSNL